MTMGARQPDRRTAVVPDQPRVFSFHERVKVAERRDHQASLAALDRDVMRQTVRLPRGSIVGQREDRALYSDEMRRGVVFVQVSKDVCS